jgi:hypothetical protein
LDRFLSLRIDPDPQQRASMGDVLPFGVALQASIASKRSFIRSGSKMFGTDILTF